MLTDGGLPHWVGWVAMLGVAALASALVVTHAGSSSGHKPAPSASSRAAAPPSRRAADDVLDVASGSDGTWVLTGGALTLVAGTAVLRRAPIDDVPLPADSEPRLAVDPAARRIWIVVSAAAPSELIEYDTASLERIRRVTWGVLVHGAVAYQDHLYLATDLGVADLAPGARAPRLLAGLGAPDGPIALDATRGRLIVMNLGYPTRVWTYRPGQYPIRAGVALPFGGGTIAVVGDAIWVGGFTDRRAVLDRLDPATLRPTRRAAADPFGPGAVILAGGETVLWVRPGNGTDVLACVNARTGRIEQRWHIRDLVAVASRRGAALVGTRRLAYAPILANCTG